jgi:hypothetical protein
MATNEMYLGDLHFGVYLLPKEKDNKWRYSISPSFKEAEHFAADIAARTARHQQVIVGTFTNANVNLYRMAFSVVADLNTRGDSNLPLFDEHTRITIDDIIKQYKPRV